MKYIKTVFIAALVLLTVVCALPGSAAYTSAQIAQKASEFIVSQEGTYDTVVRNDNGALSIGLIGWHATRALNLLKQIVNRDQDKAVELAGQTLVNEIQSATDWERRTLTESEGRAVAALLGSAEGHAVQDLLIVNDVSGYVKSGMSLGINDPQALIMYADVENQCGSGGVYRVARSASSAAGSYSAITLDIIYNAALSDSVAGRYSSRRRACYEFAKTAFDHMDEETTTASSGTQGKRYRVTASVLRVRSGPGTSYAILTTVDNGTVLTASKTSSGWAYVEYASGKYGWVSMDYLAAIAEPTTKKPETTTKKPETSTKKPETTTKKPETTTAAPKADGTGRYVILVNDLRIRSGASLSAGIYDYLYKGNKVDVLEVKGDWGRIKYNGKKAWFYMKDYCLLLGDADMNGTVNAKDARLALRNSASLASLSAKAKLAADLNGNGTVTADEARKILRFSAGLSASL